MSDLFSHLHDEVDALEALREEAKAIVERRAKELIGKAFESVADVQEAFALVVHEIEQDMTDLTTKALKRMAQLAAARPDA